VCSGSAGRLSCCLSPDPSQRQPTHPHPHTATPRCCHQDGSAAAGPLQPALGAEEAREARWAAAWLGYTWGRAAAAGVEPLIAEERAAAWGEVAEAAGGGGGGGGREAGPGLLLEVAAGLQVGGLLPWERGGGESRLYSITSD
jgi:hypothetical protein